MLKKFPTYFGTLEQLQKTRWRSFGGKRRSEGWTPDFQSEKIFFIKIFSQNHRNIFNLFWNPPAIAELVPAGRSDSERRLEGDLEGWRDTWLQKRENVFFLRYHWSCKYFYLILELQDQIRRKERLRTAFGGRVGGLEGHLTSKERKCFFLRYHVNIFTLF